MLDELPEVLPDEVGIPEGGPNVGVTHRLLDDRRALALGEPGSDAPVSEIVLKKSSESFAPLAAEVKDRRKDFTRSPAR